MSRLSEHHQTLNGQGEGKCSVPMWCNGVSADFCDRPAYGERPPGQTYYSYGAGREMRLDGRYAGYVPGLACPLHGGPEFRVFMDGNAWCAVTPYFVNLQESAAGFGATREEAIAELQRPQ